MITVILAIHLLICIAMVAVILLQRSEGGALGIGGGGGSGNPMGGLMTGRSAGNALTKITTGLAVVFFATSLGLAIMAGGERVQPVMDTAPATPAADQQQEPSGPAAPVAD